MTIDEKYAISKQAMAKAMELNESYNISQKVHEIDSALGVSEKVFNGGVTVVDAVMSEQPVYSTPCFHGDQELTFTILKEHFEIKNIILPGRKSAITITEDLKNCEKWKWDECKFVIPVVDGANEVMVPLTFSDKETKSMVQETLIDCWSNLKDQEGDSFEELEENYS